MAATEEKYILTLDVGTTTIRSFIYNSRTEIVGKALDQIVVHYPNSGFVEIDPDELWATVIDVVNKSLQDAHLTAGQLSAMGISTQRSTFTTWSKKTGQHFHRLITWKDMRADKLVKQWNESYMWKMIKAGAYMLYLVLRSKRFRAGSVLKFMNTQVTHRRCSHLFKRYIGSNMRDVTFSRHTFPLLTILQQLQVNLSDVTEAESIGVARKFIQGGNCLAELNHSGKIHMTDVSSASATGFYDPFTMEWAQWALLLFGIPLAALPTVVDTAGAHFTSTDPEVWGEPILIKCCMADQTASMWGSCCFDVGDVKLTMGTGTFFNINTGAKPHASVSGLYPVVGWRLGQELVFVAEGANNDTASILMWARDLGLFENPADTAEIAMSVPDSDGVYFIPAFSGLGPPYNDGSAASGFIGMKPSTTKAHLVRAVLESLAFRTAQLHQCICKESNYQFSCIRLDGGVSNNDFVAQLVSDLTGLQVERPLLVEMSSLGCAHIVGLQIGIWKSKDELKSLRKIGYVFTPRPNIKTLYKPHMAKWEDAVKRMCGWYSDSRKSSQSVSITESSSEITPQNGFQAEVSSKNDTK